MLEYLSKLNRPDAGVSPWTAIGALWTRTAWQGAVEVRDQPGDGERPRAYCIEQIALDEVGLRFHAGVALDVTVVLDEVGGRRCRPRGEIVGSEPGAPPAPEQRLPAAAIRETGKLHVAAPGEPPHKLARYPRVVLRCDRGGDIQTDVAQILNMLGQKEGSRLQHQHASPRMQRGGLGGQVAPIGPRPDDDHREGRTARANGFIPGIADVARERVDRECRGLDGGSRATWSQLAKRHGCPVSYGQQEATQEVRCKNGAVATSQRPAKGEKYILAWMYSFGSTVFRRPGVAQPGSLPGHVRRDRRLSVPLKGR